MPEEIPRWKQRFASDREARSWNLTSLMFTVPLLVIGYFYYGGQVLRVAAVSVLAAAAAEFVAGRVVLRRGTLSDWNAVVIGLWIACMLPAEISLPPAVTDINPALPVALPLLYAAAGSMFAVLVAKIPFGGTLHAPFSPAAAGFAFLTVCFRARVFAYTPSASEPPVHGTSLAQMLQQGGAAIEGSQLNDILFGRSVGPMGTGGIFVIAVALLGMLVLKKRRSAMLASIGFLFVVTLTAFLFPRIMLVADMPFRASVPLRLTSAVMELCSGSLLFAAVYILPDPAILPTRWFTRLGLGMVAGGLCMLLRHIGSSEESVCFAVLLADAAMPLLYRAQAEIHHQKEFRQAPQAEEGEG